MKTILKGNGRADSVYVNYFHWYSDGVNVSFYLPEGTHPNSVSLSNNEIRVVGSQKTQFFKPNGTLLREFEPGRELRRTGNSEIEIKDGHTFKRINGKLHNPVGPAVSGNGKREWWWRGENVGIVEWTKKALFSQICGAVFDTMWKAQGEWWNKRQWELRKD